jgi:tocopherol O-methyltransferase
LKFRIFFHLDCKPSDGARNEKGIIMKIVTSKPILNEKNQIISNIANFWDKTSEGWNTIWGQHIHHGFYENEDKSQNTLDQSHSKISNVSAQEILIDKLVNLLAISPGALILDVGSGMGGSACYLAKNYQAKIVGITISETQVAIARTKANEQFKINHELMPKFMLEDAHHLKSFEDNSFDIVWSLESAEQFYHKELFIKEAKRVLKPGGQLLIATWCSSQEFFEGKEANDYVKLCQTFYLPYCPSIVYYSKILKEQFRAVNSNDWSIYVKESWSKGLLELKKYSFWQLLKIGGLTGYRFIKNLQLMNKAFMNGQFLYGVFVATK